MYGMETETAFLLNRKKTRLSREIIMVSFDAINGSIIWLMIASKRNNLSASAFAI